QPVTNFVATLDDSSVDMSWTLPIGANAVDIMARDTTGGVIGPWVEKESLTWYPGDILGVGQCHASAPCTSYSLAGLALGHTYDIDVHSEKGLSIATDVWSTAPGGGPGITSITMPAPPPPPPPTKPVAVSRFTATARTHAIVIAWGALSNATEYVYSWRAHGTAAFASKAVPGGVTSVVVPNLVAGKKYDFEVRGTNSAGPGVLSSMIQQVAGANKLGTPKAPKLASVAGHKLKTTWTATAGATSYLVQYRLVGGAWKTLKVTAGKSATSPKLVAKKSYDVRIRPYDGLVGGAYSAPTRVKVK
ncbi:MAG TPA: fibronectin type III domain-containing protein, partial [Marmoricola sp.]|nr:fibronectin type III domain-containing protein [Marmoricola sp.]